MLDTALKLEIKLHPGLNLIDIYKLFYQALFGPNHIIRDHSHVCATIQQEMKQMQGLYHPIWQELGNFSRISLSALQRLDGDTSTSAMKLTDWMLASLSEVDESAFPSLWLDLKGMISRTITFSDQHWNEVCHIVNSGAIPSHSGHYKSLYHPHYRLVDSTLDEYKEFFKIV